MPPSFKDKLFEIIQFIVAWKYNTKDVFISYVLAMDVLYNKCWRCLRNDYIRRNVLSYIYPFLKNFTSIMRGGDHYYVLFLAH